MTRNKAIKAAALLPVCMHIAHVTKGKYALCVRSQARPGFAVELYVLDGSGQQYNRVAQQGDFFPASHYGCTDGQQWTSARWQAALAAHFDGVVAHYEQAQLAQH